MKKLFELNKMYDLIRVGRDHDGGYLVEKKALMDAKFLVGMGLNDDWSFEQHFVSLNKVGVHVYDHTVDWAFWRDYYSITFKILRRRIEKTYLKRLLKYFQYRAFFRNKKHYKECIGDVTSLKNVLSRIDTAPVFLKIDIEGSEYKILEELITYADSLSGLVIEFHQVNIYLDTICQFINEFNLQLVHIHGNNYGGTSLLGYPLVLEMTFSKNPVPLNDLTPSFPHPLDQVNNKFAPEINIDFEN